MKQPLGIMKQDPGEDPPRAPSMELPWWVTLPLEMAALAVLMFGSYYLTDFIGRWFGWWTA